MRIGLISDTHGLLRPEVFDAFEGVQRILHAGDVGKPEILTDLESIAPVTAVIGNTDGFDLRDRLAEVERLELAGLAVVVVHGHRLGSPRPDTLRAEHPDADVIVYGHTHRPLIERDRDGSLVVNPGAAGPRRFDLVPSVGILELADGRADVKLVELGS